MKIENMWGKFIFIFNSPRPAHGCQAMKHYAWSKTKTRSAMRSISVSSMDDIFSSTKNNSKKRRLITDDSEISTIIKKRKFVEKVSKKSAKKRCTCSKYCHKTCIGNCDA